MNRYVVKATSPTGEDTWLARPRHDGKRTCTTIDKAEVFRTQLEAHQAIMAMPADVCGPGAKFTIETA